VGQAFPPVNMALRATKGDENWRGSPTLDSQCNNASRASV
jgi:hypothetical protein